MAEQVFWPGWEVGRCIGQGGFGAVYEISRDVFGDVEKKALKVITIPKDPGEVDFMRIEGMDDVSITASFHDKVAEIAGEYKLMGKIQGCPNIVHCDDFRYVRHENGIGWDIFIRMELLTPLTKAMDRVQTEQQIIQLGKDMCSALIACQQQNIIHRDIKPQNIFVAPEGHFKLGDFGISRTMEHTTQATGGIGTYSYMAPEVFQRKKYGPQVDIYSLGLVLYWLLNERRSPFVPLPPEPSTALANEEGRRRRFDGEPIPAPKHGSEALKKVVLKACAFRPEDRYRNAGEMLEALVAAQRKKEKNVPIPKSATGPVQDEESTKIDPAPVPAPKKKPTGKKKWLPMTAVLVVLALVIMGSISIGRLIVYGRILSPNFKDRLNDTPVQNIFFLDDPSKAPSNVQMYDVSLNEDGTVVAWYSGTDLYIAAKGSVIAPQRTSMLFYNEKWSRSLVSISFDENFDTREVTDMSQMFYGCHALLTLDLNSFVTLNVTNMRGMFQGCDSLYSLNIGTFYTNHVTDMSHMFSGCMALEALDISGFDTSQVTDMSGMFYGCAELDSVLMYDFDVANVNKKDNFWRPGKTINGRPWEEYFQ